MNKYPCENITVTLEVKIFARIGQSCNLILQSSPNGYIGGDGAEAGDDDDDDDMSYHIK